MDTPPPSPRRRQRRVDTQGLTDVSLLLERVLGKVGLQSAVEETRLLQSWKEVVGERVASQAQLQDVQNGILLIHCPAAVWRQEMRFHKESVIRAANDHLGGEVIRDLRFV